MKLKPKFNVVFLEDAHDFMKIIPNKASEKIIYNIRKATYCIDPELFKKLEGHDIWEFRTKYNGIQYRLLSFWDKEGEAETLVMSSNGFIKKTKKTPLNEIAKAESIKKEYFELKRKSSKIDDFNKKH